MKLVIGQAASCFNDGTDDMFPEYEKQLLKDYPYLQKYDKYYHQGYDAYIDNNVIIKDVDEEEFAEILDALTAGGQKLIIGYEDKYFAERYGIDFKIKIYDDYLE